MFKIDQTNAIPKINPILLHAKIYSLGLFNDTLYSANEGFINKYSTNLLIKKDSSSVRFGQSVVWQFAKDKEATIYAAAWGIYSPDGGLFRIENDKMVPISDFYGIDSNVLLNVVYDSNKDILYVGSNKKGIYEVRLDKMIDFNKFDDKAIIDFEDYGSQKIILHSQGLTFFNSNKSVAQTISLNDFKQTQVDFLKNNKQVQKKQGPESRDFELNFDIPAHQIEFHEIVKNKYTFWVSSTIGIFEVNQIGQIISYLPRHSLKIGFSTNDKFIETITYAGVNVYDNLHNLKAKHYSKFNKNTPQYIVKILNTKQKTYLLSVFNGIYTYQNNQFKSYLADRIWKESRFKHGTVNDKGQLIFATEFGNVFVVEDDKKFKIVKTILKEHLTGNTILFVEAYKDCIFIGTEMGINLYQNGKIRLIDSEQGLKDAEVTTSEIFQNELWLGTQKGYYIVDLNKMLQEQATVSSVAINKITIDGKEIDQSNYINFELSQRKLVCDHNKNSFIIDFICFLIN